MIYTFRTYNPKNIVRRLAKEMGVKTTHSGAEMMVALPDKAGKGNISGIDFRDGMCILIFNCMFHEDTTLIFPIDKRQPLNFFYCSQGELHHTIRQDNYRQQYKPMDGAIVAGTKGSEQLLEFNADTDTTCHVIQIYRHQYLPLLEKELGVLPQFLTNILHDLKGKLPVSYQMQYGMRIADALNAMVTDKAVGFAHHLRLQAKALDILYYQVLQIKKEDRESHKMVKLRPDEIDRILEARDVLVDDLDEAPSIAELSKKAGINATKLKKDFKSVFGKTIGHYLRDARLQYAWLLFTSEGYSVTRVANEVGYTNVSHFSRRFKERFGMLPKDFLKEQKSALPPDEGEHEGEG